MKRENNKRGNNPREKITEPKNETDGNLMMMMIIIIIIIIIIIYSQLNEIKKIRL